MRRQEDDDDSLFRGDNPFAGSPGTGHAIAWERAKWKEKLREVRKEHAAALLGSETKADRMCRELADALAEHDDALMPDVRRLSWSRLLGLAGYYRGKATSIPLAKARRSVRKKQTRKATKGKR